MPPRTTSRGSAPPLPSPPLLLPLLPCPINGSLALSVRIAKRFSISTCIHGVSSRKRRCFSDDKNGLFPSCHPIPPPGDLSVDFSVSFSLLVSRCPSFASSTAWLPGDLTNRLIRSSQILLFVHPARHDTTRCPSRSIYSAPRPALDLIPFSPYEIIPNTYNLDWCIYYLLSI